MTQKLLLLILASFLWCGPVAGNELESWYTYWGGAGAMLFTLKTSKTRWMLTGILIFLLTLIYWDSTGHAASIF